MSVSRSRPSESDWGKDNLCGICPYRKAVQAENDRLRALLRRLGEWDHLQTAGDGPYWLAEIGKALDAR